MLRRMRFLAGFVATAAFTFSLLVGVRSSMCAAEVELAGMMMATADAGSVTESVPPDDCMEHHGEDDAHCPFAPAGPGATCMGAVSLPATPSGLTASVEHSLDLDTPESKPHPIGAAALFHPPKS